MGLMMGGPGGARTRDPRPLAHRRHILLLLAWAANHDSKIAAFDDDRAIGGAYLAHRF